MQNVKVNKRIMVSGLGLIALFVVFLCPILGFLLACISLINYNSRKPIIQSLTIGLFFGFCAYWLNPKINIDLVRYLDDVIPYMNIGFSDFLKYATSSTILPGKHLLFYMAGLTGDAHILPFLSTGISYSVFYYVSYDYAYRVDLNSKQKKYLFLCLLAFIPFLNVVSNVRNIIAFSIFLLAVYRDMVEGKKDIITWFLYLIPVTIHIAVLMLVAIRVVVPVLSNDKVKLWKRLFIVIVILGGIFTLLYFVEAAPSSLISRYYRYVFGKADRISSGEYRSSSTLSQFTSISRLLLRFFYEVIAVFCAYILIKTRKKELLKKYELFCLITALVCIACSPVMQAIYIRFAMVLVAFCFPILIKRVFDNEILNIKAISLVFSLFVLAGLFYNFYRLYLSADIFETSINGCFRPFFIMFKNN